MRATSRKLRGVIAVGALARHLGLRTQTLKRRLRRLDHRLDGRVLIRFAASNKGHWYARLDVLRDALPDLLIAAAPDVAEEDSASPSEYSQAVGIAHELQEMRESIAKLTDIVMQLHDVVVMGAAS